MRLMFALPGLHRAGRGAEVFFESLGEELAVSGKADVLLVGSGPKKQARPYQYRQLPAVPREKFENWPRFPLFRTEYAYEDLTFAARLMLTNWRNEVDLTVTCNYPFTNFALRAQLPTRARVPHVFVTQNGDWPAYSQNAEYKLFSCNGLACTNPIYFERNRERWPCVLIPNGVDTRRFCPGTADRAGLDLPPDCPLILMVSALSPNKRVLEAIAAVADIPDAHLVVAGDGPLRDEADRLAAKVLPGRFTRGVFPYEKMPDLYRSADIFLHTTIGESFGNVYIEALACGTQIVAHDDQVTRWILTDYAELTDTTNRANLVESLKRALTQRSETRLNDGAASVAASYSWSKVAELYLEFFETIAKR